MKKRKNVEWVVDSKVGELVFVDLVLRAAVKRTLSVRSVRVGRVGCWM